MYKKLDPGSKANNGPVSVLPFIMESIWKKFMTNFMNIWKFSSVSYCVVSESKFNRSSHSQMFFKTDFPKYLAILTEKYLQTRNFIKGKLQHRCFPVRFANYFKKTFFTEHLQWLLLIQHNMLFRLIQKWQTELDLGS